MSSQFAKVFETVDYGQVLVRKDVQDDKPCVSIIMLEDGSYIGMGIECGAELDFEERSDFINNVFDKIDIESAHYLCQQLRERFARDRSKEADAPAIFIP